MLRFFFYNLQFVNFFLFKIFRKSFCYKWKNVLVSNIYIYVILDLFLKVFFKKYMLLIYFLYYYYYYCNYTGCAFFLRKNCRISTYLLFQSYYKAFFKPKTIFKYSTSLITFLIIYNFFTYNLGYNFFNKSILLSKKIFTTFSRYIHYNVIFFFQIIPP